MNASTTDTAREIAARAEAQEAYNRQLAWSRLDGKDERQSVRDARDAFAATIDEWFPEYGDGCFAFEIEA